MATVAKLLASGLIVWFGTLALLIATRILAGDIASSGMLVTNPDKDGVDPERVLAMALIPAVLGFYSIHALNTGIVTTPTGFSMPDLPEGLVSLLTGGNGLYLAGKIARRS
jgi:hypothetical protein